MEEFCNIALHFSVDQSIQLPGSVAQQPERCSNTKSLRIFRNINRPLGTPVSTRERPSRKGMFWDVFWRWQLRWLNGQIVEGCSKEKGRKSWRPLRQCWSWSWGRTEWFLFDLSERDGREVAIKERRGSTDGTPHAIQQLIPAAPPGSIWLSTWGSQDQIMSTRNTFKLPPSVASEQTQNVPRTL